MQVRFIYLFIFMLSKIELRMLKSWRYTSIAWGHKNTHFYINLTCKGSLHILWSLTQSNDMNAAMYWAREHLFTECLYC